MSPSLLMDALTSNPLATLKSCLVTLHLVGLILGLGAATLMDLLIARFLVRHKVTGDYCQIIEFSSKVVVIGLIVLWLSGLSFLTLYSVTDPHKLTNPKIWAKIAIVCVLTLNGVFIHHTVLPLLRRQLGRGLFDGLLPGQRSLLLASGIVSVTSWYVPLLLGAVPQFNFLPAAPILLLYAALLTGTIAATQSFAVMIERRNSRQQVWRPVDCGRTARYFDKRPDLTATQGREIGRAIAQHLMTARVHRPD